VPVDPSAAFRLIREDDMDNSAVQGFVCGDEEWEDKVATFLRSGEALREQQDKKARSQTLLYCANNGEGELIGFVNVVKRKVGYPLYHGDPRISCFLITWLAIHTTYHRQGYASAMLEALVITAVAANVDSLYLLVDARNIAAIRLYQKFGFVAFADAELHVDKDDGSKNLRMIRLLRDVPVRME